MSVFPLYAESVTITLTGPKAKSSKNENAQLSISSSSSTFTNLSTGVEGKSGFVLSSADDNTIVSGGDTYYLTQPYRGGSKMGWGGMGEFLQYAEFTVPAGYRFTVQSVTYAFAALYGSFTSNVGIRQGGETTILVPNVQVPSKSSVEATKTGLSVVLTAGTYRFFGSTSAVYTSGKYWTTEKIILSGDLISTTHKTLYLDLHSFPDWENDFAKFVVLDGTTNYDMTLIETDCYHVYKVDNVPYNANNLYFKRCDQDGDTWNEVHVENMGSNNMLTVTDWNAGTPGMYVPSVSVTFDVQGGSAVAKDCVLKGSPVTRPTDPTKSGYSFTGWYENDACTGSAWDFSTPITADKTLYAGWSNSWYYHDGSINSWEAKLMTESADGQYWYYQVPESNDNRGFVIQRNGVWYGREKNIPGFSCTNISNMNSASNTWNTGQHEGANICAVNYKDGNYYIIVYVPNTGANPTNDPVICASTTLPDETGYSTVPGKTIYFDNSLTQWTNVYFRIGRKCHNSKWDATNVPGTQNLYKVTTEERGQDKHYYDNYVAFHFADNVAWTGDGNSIYTTRPGSYNIDNAVDFQKYTIDQDLTIIPGEAYGSAPQYYHVSTTPGMLTHILSISESEVGSIAVTYTDVDEEKKSMSADSRRLAHTCIVTVTPTLATGYTNLVLKVNDASVELTEGKYTFALTTDADLSLSATPQSCVLTLDGNSHATNGSITYAYNQPISGSNPSAKTPLTNIVDGYTLSGFWYEGVKVMNADYTLVRNVFVPDNKGQYVRWTTDEAQPRWVGPSLATLYAHYQHEVCAGLGTNQTINADKKTFNLDGTSVTPSGLRFDSDKADFDNGADVLNISNPNGIRSLKVTANYYTGVNKESHLFADYSADGVAWTSTERIPLTSTSTSFTLAVPAGTNYIRLHRSLAHTVTISNICVEEGTSAYSIPSINWTTSPVDGIIDGQSTIAATASCLSATSCSITGYYSSDPAIAAATNGGTLSYLKAGLVTIYPEATVTYESDGPTHLFMGPGASIQVRESAGGCDDKVMMWKETNLYNDAEVGTYQYSYRPANHYSNYFDLRFLQGAGVSASTYDRAMEFEGSALTTGKFAGGGFIFTVLPGSDHRFSRVQFFGKFENDAFEYTTDGTSWQDLVVDGAKVGKDAVHTFDLPENITCFGIRNKGVSGVDHKGVWIRNMAITVCGSGYAADPTIPFITSQTLDRSEGNARMTVAVQGETGSLGSYTYDYTWYRCNYQGGETEVITPSNNAPSFTISSEYLTFSGTMYFICHVREKDGTAVTHSRVFTVHNQPDNALITWNLEPSAPAGTTIRTLSTEVREGSHTTWLSGLNTSSTITNNGAVGGMTAKIGITAKERIPWDWTNETIQFGLEDGYSLRVDEILLEIQPVSYRTECFAAVLKDDNGNRIEGKLRTPVPGMGNLMSFTYNSETRLSGNIVLLLYAWDPVRDDATYRLGTKVSLYGEVLGKPDPDLMWTTIPSIGQVDKSGDVVKAVSSDSKLTVTYSSSDPSIASVNSTTGALTYARSGKVTLYATTTGDGNIFRRGAETTISRTIIVDDNSASEQCSTPHITVTGDDSGTATFCECEVGTQGSDYERWSGLTASDDVNLLPHEHRIIQWFYDKDELAIVEDPQYASLTIKPTQAGVYRAVVTIYNVEDSKKTMQTQEVSVRVRLLEAPAKPTISGPGSVEQNQSVSLVAQSVGALSYKWYHQEPGAPMPNTPIGGATAQAYTFSTNANTPLGRHFFYCVGVNSSNIAGCTESEFSTSFMVDVTAVSGCDWHFKMSDEDAASNEVEVCEHIVFTDKDDHLIPFDRVENVQGCVIDGQAFSFTKVTSPSVPSIHFPLMAGHSGTAYIYVRGNATISYSNNAGRATGVIGESVDWQWRLLTMSVDAPDVSLVYTISADRPVSIALCAARVCQPLDDDWNVPSLTVLNNGACGSVTLQASGYTRGAHLTWYYNDHTGTHQMPQETYDQRKINVTSSATYWVVAHNESTLKASTKQANSVLRVVQVGALPSFSGTIDDFTGEVGRTYTIPSTIVGADSYQWYKCDDKNKTNAYPIPGETNPSAVRTVLPSHYGRTDLYFFCRGTNDCGYVETNAFQMTVTDPSEVSDCDSVGGDFEQLYFSLHSSAWRTDCHRLDDSKFIEMEAKPGYHFKGIKYKVWSQSDSDRAYAFGTSTDGSTYTYTAQSCAGTTKPAEQTSPQNITWTSNDITAIKIVRKDGSIGGSSGYRYFSDICVTLAPDCKDPGLEFSKTTVAATKSSGVTEPTLTNPYDLAVTYTSSNTNVATVDASKGDVTPVANGTTTITAQLTGAEIEKGYCSTATAEYQLIISAHIPTIVKSPADREQVNCSTSVTLTVKNQSTDYPASAKVQWYRNGLSIFEANRTTYTAAAAGIYTAVVTYDGQTVSSSEVVLTSTESVPVVERLSPFHYYRRGCDYTGDTDNPTRHLFRVTPRGTSGAPWSVEAYKFASDGSDNGKIRNATVQTFVKPDPLDPNMVLLDMPSMASVLTSTGTLAVGDTMVITVAPRNACDRYDYIYSQSIPVYVVERDTRSLAYIVSGGDESTVVLGGDFLTGYNHADLLKLRGKADWTNDPEPLYADLQRHYAVTPVNGYAFNDLSGSRIYQYEPFDIILMTDYPKTDAKVNGVSNASAPYINALAQLVDYRPMLSLKAHMAKSTLPAWKEKGFVAQPYVPVETQLSMHTLCFAHEIFSGMTNPPTSKNPDLQILSAAGFDNGKGLQGFRLSDVTGFLTIGTICESGSSTGASGTINEPLVVCLERQKNIAARMMVLSINAQATCKVDGTNESNGMEAIAAILRYLLMTDPSRLSDCAYEFTKAGEWSVDSLWAQGKVPPTGVEVRILANCTVDIVTPEVATLTIAEGKTVTVNPNAALRCAASIQTGTRYQHTMVTNADMIRLLAGGHGDTHQGKTGALIHGDKLGNTAATVQMYSSASYDYEKHEATWTWMTTPYNDSDPLRNYYGSYIRQWSNTGHSWTSVPTGQHLRAFEPYEINQDNPTVYHMTGTLASTESRVFALTKGLNLIGNSWTAPIQIARFTEADFVNTEATIVMLNTGTDVDGTANIYVSVPINTAGSVLPEANRVIPSMQTFQVYTNEGGGSLTLDYDRLVRANLTVQPIHAPGRDGRKAWIDRDVPIGEKLLITVSGSRYSDYICLYQHDQSTMHFDNGWDGSKYYSSNWDIPMLLVRFDESDWQVSTQPTLVGTQISFYQGEDPLYTISFDYEGYETLWLHDKLTNHYTAIETSNTYVFYSNTYDVQHRFEITDVNPNQGVSTSVDGAEAVEPTGQKLLIEDKLHILTGGRLYDAMGRQVK